MFSRIRFTPKEKEHKPSTTSTAAREAELEVCPKRRLSSQAAKNAASIIKSIYRRLPDSLDPDDHEGGDELEFNLQIIAGASWTKISKHWYYETSNGAFDGRWSDAVMERGDCYLVQKHMSEGEACELVRGCYETLLLESSQQLSTGRASLTSKPFPNATLSASNSARNSAAFAANGRLSMQASPRKVQFSSATSSTRNSISQDFTTSLLQQAKLAYWASPWEVEEAASRKNSRLNSSTTTSRKSSRHNDSNTPSRTNSHGEEPRRPSAWPRGFSSTLQSGFYGRRRKAAEKLFNRDWASSRKRSSGAATGVKRQPTLPVPPDMSEAMARAMQKLALEAENEEVEVVQEVDVFAHHEGVEVGPGGGRRGAVRPAPVARRSDPMAWSS